MDALPDGTGLEAAISTCANNRILPFAQPSRNPFALLAHEQMIVIRDLRTPRDIEAVRFDHIDPIRRGGDDELLLSQTYFRRSFDGEPVAVLPRPLSLRDCEQNNLPGCEERLGLGTIQRDSMAEVAPRLSRHDGQAPSLV